MSHGNYPYGTSWICVSEIPSTNPSSMCKTGLARRVVRIWPKSPRPVPLPPSPSTPTDLPPRYAFPLPSLTPHTGCPLPVQIHPGSVGIWHRETSTCPCASFPNSGVVTNMLYNTFTTLLGQFNGLTLDVCSIRIVLCMLPI